MRTLVFVTLAIAVLLTLTTHARAQFAFKNGNILLANCHDDNMLFVAECSGYIIGIFDTLAANPVNGFTACSVPNSTPRQVIDVVIAWLDEHPELRHYAASGLVAQALAEAFPCPLPQ